jgi:hypothetical protein
MHLTLCKCENVHPVKLRYRLLQVHFSSMATLASPNVEAWIRDHQENHLPPEQGQVSAIYFTYLPRYIPEASFLSP